jgi:hypothetical protein
MALTVRLSPEWRSDDITIPEGGSFLAFVKDSPHPVVVFKVEEFDGGFAVANFKPGKGSTFYAISEAHIQSWAEMPKWGIKK